MLLYSCGSSPYLRDCFSYNPRSSLRQMHETFGSCSRNSNIYELWCMTFLPGLSYIVKRDVEELHHRALWTPSCVEYVSERTCLLHDTLMSYSPFHSKFQVDLHFSNDDSKRWEFVSVCGFFLQDHFKKPLSFMTTVEKTSNLGSLILTKLFIYKIQIFRLNCNYWLPQILPH